jgi:hypothetical protein
LTDLIEDLLKQIQIPLWVRWKFNLPHCYLPSPSPFILSDPEEMLDIVELISDLRKVLKVEEEQELPMDLSSKQRK